MKYKKGDIVRTHSWESLMREFGTDDEGNIIINDNGRFLKLEDRYKNDASSNFKILEIIKDQYRVKSNDGDNLYLRDILIEGPAFEYGEEIEASDDNKNFNKCIYITYVSGALFPYIVTNINSFENGNKFIISQQRSARKIEKQENFSDFIIEKNGKRYKMVECE